MNKCPTCTELLNKGTDGYIIIITTYQEGAWSTALLLGEVTQWMHCSKTLIPVSDSSRRLDLENLRCMNNSLQGYDYTQHCVARSFRLYPRFSLPILYSYMYIIISVQNN